MTTPAATTDHARSQPNPTAAAPKASEPLASDSTPAPTPTDDPAPPRPRRRKPTAGNRYELFDDGEGNFRIYELSKADGVPKGTLIPIPGVPGFENQRHCIRFINNSGDLLRGKQLMVLRGLEICSVDVKTVSRVSVNYKPKRPIGGPAASAGEDGQ